MDPSTGQISVIDVPIAETWNVMEELVKKGKVRSIGVSNFTQVKLESILKTLVGSSLLSIDHCRILSDYVPSSATIPPAVNQIEAHAYLQQPEFLAWMKEKVSKVMSACMESCMY